jgi:hypothetical protein
LYFACHFGVPILRRSGPAAITGAKLSVWVADLPLQRYAQQVLLVPPLLSIGPRSRADSMTLDAPARLPVIL